MKTHEQIAAPDVTIDSIESVRQSLYPHLEHYVHPLINQIQTALAAEMPLFDLDNCREVTQEQLATEVGTYAIGFRGSAAKYITSTFPDNQPDIPIESPGHYAKSIGSGSLRPELRAAHTQEIKHSRVALADAIKSEEIPESVQESVTDDQVNATIQELRTKLNENLRDDIAALQYLIPLPDKNQRRSLLRQMGIHRPLAAVKFHIIDETQPQETLAEFYQVTNNFLEDLYCMHHLGLVIAEEAVNLRREQAFSHVRSILSTRYQQLAVDEARRLQERVQTAYARVAQRTPTRTSDNQPAPADARPIPTPRMVAPEQQPVRVAVTQEEIPLGTIESPFPWAEGVPVDLSLLTHGDKRLVVCEAMTPVTKQLSEQMETDTRNAKLLGRLWDKAQEIELLGNAATHGMVKMVRFVNFHNMTICYFGNTGPNCGRIYYAKTNVGQFPDLLATKTPATLEPHTPLLVLIGRTDKQHQLKVMQEFGVRRASAKAGRAGAV
jgi:hypothetical protein